MKKFYTKLISDLEWVIASPSIFNADCHNDPLNLENNTSEILKLCANSRFTLSDYSEKLTEFLDKRNIRLLGKYFEALFEFGLTICPDIELLISNRQIADKNGNTIGEIDFLFRNLRTGRLHHLELAGKFYIAFDNTPDWNNFIGPNPNDNLAKKMEHLFVKQVPLLNTAFGRNFLEEHNISESIVRSYLVKGYIFYYFRLFREQTFRIPINSNKNHLKGWWIRISEIRLIKDSDIKYFILERNEWMKTMPRKKEDLLTFDQTKELALAYFNDNKYPLLVSRFNMQSGFCTEHDRGFIISEFWPNTEQL